MSDRTCSIDDCTKLEHARGWCGTHYERWRQHGDPLVVAPRSKRRPVADRFWSMVDKGPAESCWQWTGSLLRDGYGSFWADDRTVSAHRFIYEFLVGPVPQGLDLDHTCHNEAAIRGECDGGKTCPHRACVNPAHLEPVTHNENTKRGLMVATNIARGRDRTRCKWDHLLDAANTYVEPGGGRRRCRTCRTAASLRRRARLAGR